MWQLSGVHKYYPSANGPVPVLQDINLTVARGDRLVVCGPSGSGKTTLVKLLGLLTQASAGEMWLDGHRVAELSSWQCRQLRNRHIGFVFQDFQLLPDYSLLENLMLPLKFAGMAAKARKRRALELLDQLGLAAQAQRFPDQVSGGQCQRAAVARALACEPSLILADEPTGNLDRQNAQTVVDLLLTHASPETAVVLVTHDPAFFHAGTACIHLQDGRLRHDQTNGSTHA